jgi:hypothetical protein
MARQPDTRHMAARVRDTIASVRIRRWGIGHRQRGVYFEVRLRQRATAAWS